MGYSTFDTLDNIYNADNYAIEFLDEWHNKLPYIIANTSGSTGIPKQIKLLKSDLIKSATATCKYFNIDNSSTLVSPLSSRYIAGKMMIVRAIVSGAKLWIETPSNKPLSNDYGTIDLLPVVPSQVEWLLNEYVDTKCIKNLIVGGGNLSKKYEDSLIKLGINTYVTYGMTETCSHIALRNIPNQIYETLSGITISNDDRNCLVINAPQFSFNEIITNDIVEILDNRHFKWIGRYDNIINSGGIKISPEKIEKQLSSVISDPFFIIGEPDDKWGESITLYIEGENVDKAKILYNAKSILDNYCVPKKIKCVSKFEKTESGKILRRIY